MSATWSLANTPNPTPSRAQFFDVLDAAAEGEINASLSSMIYEVRCSVLSNLSAHQAHAPY
jgi:hypothetical protein